ASKDLVIELAVAPAAQFLGDRGDLTELLGNLLDNACKWCRTRVRFAATTEASAGPRERLCLVVEDDGPGNQGADRSRGLQGGVRTDEKVPGHGLGLSMVHDPVDLYGGDRNRCLTARGRAVPPPAAGPLAAVTPAAAYVSIFRQ